MRFIESEIRRDTGAKKREVKRPRLIERPVVRTTAYYVSIFAFVFFAGLLAIFAVAEKKGEPFNAFFAAFGAIGQVAFAYLVFRLSKTQFEFAKLVAERQHKIDSFAERAKVISRWRSLDRDTEKKLSAETRSDILDWIAETRLLFSDDVVKMAQNASSTFRVLLQLDDVQNEVGEFGTDDAQKQWENEFDMAMFDFYQKLGRLLTEMEFEARVA